jgi:ribosomal protein S18 acetylase RimI-like enzyme
MRAVALELQPFHARHAELVLSWVRTPEEADRWASAGARELRPELLREWHADADVHPYVCTDGGEPVGYGEVWHDAGEAEAELARILVAPEQRGRGVGRGLTGLLAAEAGAAGFDKVWLRVVPDNHQAVAAYRAVGFVRATAEEEQAFNEGQPVAYLWMRLQSLLRAG